MIEFLKKNKRIAIAVGIALVVVAIYAVMQANAAPPATQFQTTVIEPGDLTATVGATGTVRAQSSAALIWQANGTVEKVYVKVGDRVKLDQVLASLDKTSLPQNVILAEADLVSAQKALEDLLNSDTARAQALIALKDAQEDYDTAYDYRKSLEGKIELKKVTFIYIGGQEIPKVKYYKGYADEETKANADDDLALAKAKLEDAQRTYDRVKDGPSAEDIAAAEARVAAAQATLDMAQVTAPFAGTITQAQPAVGDRINAGSVAFRVDDLTHLLVDVQVSEVDINSVSLGQTATLSFDAILGKEYHGEVVEVGQAGDTVQGVVNFTVTVEITDADEQVKPGMTAAVTVTVKEINNVLLVPNRAVRLVDNERVVYVLKDGLPVKVKIRLGQSSDTMSAVVGDDLKEGDLIILNPPSEGGNGPFGG